MPPANELVRAKRWATGLLLLVAGIFVATHFLPSSVAVQALQATAEAAMVGALADWFAVSALFKRIPLPLVGRHTAIIPRNKNQIGANLASFVREKFLDTPSLIALLRRYDVAQWMAHWLSAPHNSRLLGLQLARLAGAALEMVQDQQVERLLTRVLRSVIARMDITQSLATVLQALTHGGKHQAVLDDVLAKISQTLQQEDTRAFIAQTMVQWLKREHPLTEKMLPSDWLSGKGAQMLAQALDSVLTDMAQDPEHRLREAFDRALTTFIARLRTDAAYAAKAEEVRRYLLHDPNLSGYLHGLWSRMRSRLQQDLANPQSWVAQRLAGMGQWLGQSLAEDAALRASMNARLERWTHALAPEVSALIAAHISDTVQRWDAQELSALVEQHIGKDLQFIRINGTVVGGCVGLLLFVVGRWL